MTVSVDGRKIHEAPLPAECDPWLARLHAGAPDRRRAEAQDLGQPGDPRAARSLRPARPDRLARRLLRRSVGGDDPDWDKRGDEIVGRLRADAPGTSQESVLRYNRPLLEDGEIDYEFYLRARQGDGPPRLDRLTFLLEPDGVKIHWMTDAQYDRSGLAPTTPQ